ncbi:hypothetical protein [Bdellovibrio sp. HCB337]|uniref:hypothetical protein n=1 Tax=Bdellovibrio sp. HCB337 TaxID=3394358 RepID=UPI0039A6869C
MKRGILVLSLLSLAGVVLFQNCGRINMDANGFEVPEVSLDMNSEAFSTGDICEDELLNEFLRPQGYYEFLKDVKRCGNCHDGSTPGAPPFVHDNKLMAWDAFYQKELSGTQEVSTRAVSAHQPGFTGSQNAPYIEDLKRQMELVKPKYNSCKGIPEVVAKSLTTPTLAMDFLADVGTPLVAAETAFTRTEAATYFEAGKYVTQTFTLNPYQRIIYDEKTNRWKVFQLKKFVNPTLTAEETAHTRVETYGTQKFTLNPYQRVVTNATTKVPEVAELSRSVEKKFNLRSGIYTPEKVGDEPYLEFSAEIYRGHEVTPVKKTFAITEAPGKVVNVTRITGYTQVLDNYIVVRKPSFKMSQAVTNTAYSIKGMSILVNANLRAEATVYSILDGNICDTTKITLMNQNNSQIMVFNSILATDKLSFKFNDLNAIAKTANLICSSNNTTAPVVNIPASVTYTQLTGTTDLGVFRSQCLTCHNSIDQRGGLDLSNYDAAKARVSKIVDRMNDAGAPMPQSGLLDTRSRELVRKWMSLGAPK